MFLSVENVKKATGREMPKYGYNVLIRNPIYTVAAFAFLGICNTSSRSVRIKRTGFACLGGRLAIKNDFPAVDKMRT